MLWVGGVSSVVQKSRSKAPLCLVLLVDELDRVLLVRSVLVVGRPSLASLLLFLLFLSIHASGGVVGFWPRHDARDGGLTPDPAHPTPTRSFEHRVTSQQSRPVILDSRFHEQKEESKMGLGGNGPSLWTARALFRSASLNSGGPQTR